MGNRKGGRQMTLDEIVKRYGVPKTIIRKYFPRGEVRRFRSRKGFFWTQEVWSQAAVESSLLLPEVKEAVQKRREELLELQQCREITALFAQYSPEAYVERARRLDRQFILHVGPTNSGKTYDAIEDLKKWTPGTYLGPLRLLALEMYDKINAAGIPCTMLTGEEYLPVEGAEIISSTIELCDTHTHFKTAVIDEAQLIADPSRGASWLRAICLVDADVVHICMAPEALGYISNLVRSFGTEPKIVRHERLAPLRYGGSCRDYRDLRADDAVICFSRKNVLATAALLERSGFRASVIYGALPPEARRNEVRKYLSGETDIVVATDAIGMGISLPIRRVVFAETEKFDGRQFRALSTAEINQIGGRAGRYGMHEKGEVLVLGDDPIIGNKLGQSVRALKASCIAFPREVLATDYPLRLLLKTWQALPGSGAFLREDMSEALTLLSRLRGFSVEEQKELCFELITCPVDTRNDELVRYWADCARAILRGRKIPYPPFGTKTLLDCELQYKAFDIHHQLLRRIGRSDDCSAQRRAICERIAELMRQSKEEYIRHCRVCGKELPLGSVSNLCDACYLAQGMSGRI